jgi:hypothetical protein
MKDNAPRKDRELPQLPDPAKVDTFRGFTKGLARSAKQADLGFPLAVFVTTRLLLSLLGLALWAAGLVPTTPNPVLRPYFGYPPTVHGLAGMLLGVWERFDAIHYLRIAASGYTEAPLTAFSAFYPMLTRFVGVVLGDRWTLAGILVSNLACLLAFIFLFKLVGDITDDPGVRRRAVAYLAFFPTGFFLLAPYPESLLLLLSILIFYLAHRGDWLGVFFCGLAAGLTRSQGLLLCLPVAYIAYQEFRRNRRYFPFIAAAAPALGVAAGLAAYLMAGFPPAAQVQATYWGRTASLPLQGVFMTVGRIMAGNALPIEFVDLAVVVFMGLLAWAGLRRLPAAYSLYLWTGLLINLSTVRIGQPLSSEARWAVMLFPAFITLAFLGRRPWVHRLIFYPSTALFLFLAGQYIMWGWVG